MVINCVAQVHSRGVIHQDIKPSNFLIGQDGSIKLCDFNLSRLVNDTARAHGGTIPYFSPHMLDNLDEGFAADWWALGVTLYQLLHGLDTWPFSSKPLPTLDRLPPAEQLALVRAAVAKAAVRFRPLCDLPRAARTLIRGLLQPQLEKRWGLLQILAGNYPCDQAFSAVALRFPRLSQDMERLLALRRLCQSGPPPARCLRSHGPAGESSLGGAVRDREGRRSPVSASCRPMRALGGCLPQRTLCGGKQPSREGPSAAAAATAAAAAALAADVDDLPPTTDQDRTGLQRLGVAAAPADAARTVTACAMARLPATPGACPGPDTFLLPCRGPWPAHAQPNTAVPPSPPPPAWFTQPLDSDPHQSKGCYGGVGKAWLHRRRTAVAAAVWGAWGRLGAARRALMPRSAAEVCQAAAHAAAVAPRRLLTADGRLAPLPFVPCDIRVNEMEPGVILEALAALQPGVGVGFAAGAAVGGGQGAEADAADGGQVQGVEVLEQMRVMLLERRRGAADCSDSAAGDGSGDGSAAGGGLGGVGGGNTAGPTGVRRNDNDDRPGERWRGGCRRSSAASELYSRGAGGGGEDCGSTSSSGSAGGAAAGSAGARASGSNALGCTTSVGAGGVGPNIGILERLARRRLLAAATGVEAAITAVPRLPPSRTDLPPLPPAATVGGTGSQRRCSSGAAVGPEDLAAAVPGGPQESVVCGAKAGQPAAAATHHRQYSFWYDLDSGESGGGRDVAGVRSHCGRGLLAAFEAAAATAAGSATGAAEAGGDDGGCDHQRDKGEGPAWADDDCPSREARAGLAGPPDGVGDRPTGQSAAQGAGEGCTARVPSGPAQPRTTGCRLHVGAGAGFWRAQDPASAPECIDGAGGGWAAVASFAGEAAAGGGDTTAGGDDGGSDAWAAVCVRPSDPAAANLHPQPNTCHWRNPASAASAGCVWPRSARGWDQTYSAVTPFSQPSAGPYGTAENSTAARQAAVGDGAAGARSSSRHCGADNLPCCRCPGTGYDFQQQHVRQTYQTLPQPYSNVFSCDPGGFPYSAFALACHSALDTGRCGEGEVDFRVGGSCYGAGGAAGGAVIDDDLSSMFSLPISTVRDGGAAFPRCDHSGAAFPGWDHSAAAFPRCDHSAFSNGAAFAGCHHPPSADVSSVSRRMRLAQRASAPPVSCQSARPAAEAATAGVATRGPPGRRPGEGVSARAGRPAWLSPPEEELEADRPLRACKRWSEPGGGTREIDGGGLGEDSRRGAVMGPPVGFSGAASSTGGPLRVAGALVRGDATTRQRHAGSTSPCGGCALGATAAAMTAASAREEEDGRAAGAGSEEEDAGVDEGDGTEEEEEDRPSWGSARGNTCCRAATACSGSGRPAAAAAEW